MNVKLSIIALVLVPALALAGCLRAADELPLTTLAEGVEGFSGGYTWPAPTAQDGQGNTVPMPAAYTEIGAAPTTIEQPLPGGGGEPNIGITSSGAMFVTTFDQVQRSRDQGRTWEVVHDFTSPNVPMTEDYFSTADPMLWVDTVTDRVYANHMHPAIVCTYLAWSDDEGETWTERPFACGTPRLDHQKIMTAIPGPATLPISPAGVAYPTVLYLCVNKLDLGTWCAVSYDGGFTFPYDTQVAPTSNCGALNGHPAGYPDGTVVVPLGSFGGCLRKLQVSVTEDSGVTWVVRDCGLDLVNVEVDADITVTPDGTAYMLYRGRDNLVHLLRTTDKFVTCEDFLIAPKDQVMSAFTVITSGDNGRIAMAYLGTRMEQNIDDDEIPEPSTATPGTFWYLYVTTSFDADSENPTFVTHQVSPEEDPVQVGCIWFLGGGGGVYGCRNLLDFIDMTRDADGRYYVAITDGCTPRNGCTGEPFQSDFQSLDRTTAVAVQESGMSLFADKGILAALGLERTMPYPR